MGKEASLPKNIRQIGDIQGKEKICIEDYVMTYIRKKEPQEEKGFLGVFLGERQETEDFDYTFIRGILEISFEEEEEKIRDQMEKERESNFPGWEIMGCCVIGTYPTKRLELLASIAPEAERLIFHLQEQEENLYLKEQGNYRKMRGYLVFYEQNRKMQDYLAETFGEASVEKESLPDKAIKSFRQKVKEKGEQKSRSLLKLASSFFVITVLAIGAIVVNKMDEIRSVSSRTGGTDSSDSAAASLIDSQVQQEGEQLLASSTDVADESAAAMETESWLAGSDAFWQDTIEDENTAGGTEESSTEENITEETELQAAGAQDDSVQSSMESETSEAAARELQAAYVIKTGDTLANICKMYYGSMDRLEEICEINNITDANMILPGQKIVLP